VFGQQIAPGGPATLTFTTLFISAFCVVLVVSPWSHAIMLDVDDAFDLVGSLVAALFAVGLIRHAPRRELKVEAARTRRAPRLIGEPL
jgi:uncharacterized membrane protein YccC